MTCYNCNLCKNWSSCGKWKKCCLVKILAFIAIILIGLFAFQTYAQYWYSFWWGWGWRWSYSASTSSSLQRDNCSEDLTLSYYDWLCSYDWDIAENATTGPILVEEVSSLTNVSDIEIATIVETEYEIITLINEKKEDVETFAPLLETITLPAFLPETWAL